MLVVSGDDEDVVGAAAAAADDDEDGYDSGNDDVVDDDYQRKCGCEASPPSGTLSVNMQSFCLRGFESRHLNGVGLLSKQDCDGFFLFSQGLCHESCAFCTWDFRLLAAA